MRFAWRSHCCRSAFLVVAALCVAGCVERRMTIVTDPPGALVSVNNVELGASPVDVPTHLFQYYGNYDIKAIRAGYEPLLVKQPVPPPWYEVFPAEFFSENVVPWHIKDNRVLEFHLVPQQLVPHEDLLRNAEAQRSRGQTIGPPPAVVIPADQPPPTDVPPAQTAPAQPSGARLEAPIFQQ